MQDRGRQIPEAAFWKISALRGHLAFEQLSEDVAVMRCLWPESAGALLAAGGKI